MAIEVQDLVEVTVQGKMHNQSVVNQFHYRLATLATGDISVLLAAFRAVWRASYLANISDQYEVVYYLIKKVEGVIWIARPGVPLGHISALRYTDASTLAGVPETDAGQLATAALPSFACMGFRKNCHRWERENSIDALPLERTPRGGFRVSGIVEDDTVLAQGNDLTPEAVTWGTALGIALKEIETGASRLHMEVVSLIKDGIPRQSEIVPPPSSGPVNEPRYAVADVTSITVNPFVTSQVSRKQTVSNLS